MLLAIHTKTGFCFPKFLQTRITNYQVMEQKNKARQMTLREELNFVINKIDNYLTVKAVN